MPAPRRRNAGKAPEPASETVVEPDAGTDSTESEDKPKRVRAPKEYKIVSEEMADLVNEFLDTEEFSEGDEITGELINRLRAEGKGMKWDGTDENPGIKYVAGIKSAIPLRTILQKHETASGEDALDPENAQEVLDAMKADGAGWTQLSVRTGLSVPDVKALLKDLLDAEDIDVEDGGRGYGKGDSWRWVSRDELNASKAANKEAGDDDEDGDEDDDDSESDDEQPAPRRGRRAGANA